MESPSLGDVHPEERLGDSERREGPLRGQDQRGCDHGRTAIRLRPADVANRAERPDLRWTDGQPGGTSFVPLWCACGA